MAAVGTACQYGAEPRRGAVQRAHPARRAGDADRRTQCRQEQVRQFVRAASFTMCSLLNLLCQRDAAIVTAVAGTTRDVLAISADVGGFPVVLRDTAGLRFGPGIDEAETEARCCAHGAVELSPPGSAAGCAGSAGSRSGAVRA